MGVRRIIGAGVLLGLALMGSAQATRQTAADSWRTILTPNKPSHLARSETWREAPVPEGVLVAFHKGLSAANRPPDPRTYGFDHANSVTSGNGGVWRLGWRTRPTRDQVRAAVDRLRALDSVRWAEADSVVTAQQAALMEPEFPQQWALQNTGQRGGFPGADISAPEAWMHVGPFATVEVAILDTGIDAEHEEIQHATLPGVDLIGAGTEAGDPNGHGTTLAGVMVMNPRNQFGGAGVAPNVRVRSYRVLNSAGVGETSAMIRGLDLAGSSLARVINLSWATADDSVFLREAIERVLAADKLIVTVAGNHGRPFRDFPAYPAAYRQKGSALLVVGSSGRRDELAPFSAHGAGVDLLAPGIDILTAWPWEREAEQNQGLIEAQGTSVSAAMVSASAAYVWGLHPEWSALQVAARLRAGADVPAAQTDASEYGRLNLARSLVEDTVPPHAPGRVRVIARTPTRLTLAWDSPSDPFPQEPVQRYEVVVSTSLLEAREFRESQRSALAMSPREVDVTQEYDVTDLTPGVPVYVGLRSVDGAGNASNVVVVGPVAPIAPRGTEQDVLKSWTATPGTWAQTALISGGDPRQNPGELTWMDSPQGLTPVNSNARLTLNAALPAGQPLALLFRCALDLEEGPDALWLEIQSGPSGWQPVWRGTGQRSWRTIMVPLPLTATTAVRLRFRLVTDGVGATDGVSLRQLTLIPLRELQSTTFDHGSPWTTTDGWGFQSVNPFSAPRAWADSPAGNYANLADAWTILSAPVQRHRTGTTWLMSVMRYDIEPFYDQLQVLHRVNPEDEWEILDLRDGTQSWQWSVWSLPKGAQSDLAFRLTSDDSVNADGVVLDNVSVVAEPEEVVRAVAVRVRPRGFAGDLSDTTWTVRIRDSRAHETRIEVAADALGQLFIPLGELEVELALERLGFLRARVAAVPSSGSPDLGEVDLIPGDADGDNEVSVFDYDALSQAFDSRPGTPEWNPAVDFNGDGVISVADYDLLSQAFDLVGAP